MTTLLVDTHVLQWWSAEPDRLSAAALDALEATFSESKTALIAIAPKDGTVFTRETLGAIETLTEAAWQVP